MARPVAFVSASGQSYSASPGTSIVISTPASVQPGDLMIAFIVRNRDDHDQSSPGNLNVTNTTPATWHFPDYRDDYQAYTDGGSPLPGWATRFGMLWKTVEVGEAASHTFTAASTPDNIRAGVIVAYRYVSLQWNENINDYDPHIASSMSVTNIGTSIAGRPDGRLLTITSRGTPSYSSGTQRVTASGSSGATTCYVSVADESITTSAATGTRTVTGGSVGPSPEITRLMMIAPQNYSTATLMP
jgi:hypothetical protein